MTFATDQPENTNFLSPANFTFSIQKLPIFSKFITKLNIPAIGLQTAKIPTPMRPIVTPGNPANYESIKIEYKVDEDLVTYISLFNWIHGIGLIDNGSEYAQIASQANVANGIYSDATLMIFDSSKTPNIKFTFNNLVPTELGGFELDSTVTDITYITSSVTFEFQTFQIQPA